jgi:hypothetical protein
MQPAFDRTDWSVLSTLLRMAQRDGWRVEFAPDCVLVSSRRATEGVVTLPAVLVRHAEDRAGGRLPAESLTPRSPGQMQRKALSGVVAAETARRVAIIRDGNSTPG